MVHLALQAIDEENTRARRQFTNVSNIVIDQNLKNAFEGLRRLALSVAGTVEIPPLLPDQAEYLKRIHDQTGKYDPKVMVGGPDKARGNSQ